jgi:hypothetical protein
MTDPTEVHAYSQQPARQRAAVQRDVERLLDELAPERPVPKHDTPVAAIVRHRSPGRCILQGPERAITISWFPAQGSDDTLGQLVIIAWRGTVSLPGSARRSSIAAEPLHTWLLTPTVSVAGCQWVSPEDEDGIDIAELITRCHAMLERGPHAVR